MTDISEIKQKFETYALEVEDIIDFAAAGGNAADLRALARDWDRLPLAAEQKSVPFGTWADVACSYLEHGGQGLVRAVESGLLPRSIVLGFLSEVITNQNALAAVELLKTGNGAEELVSAASAINLLLSFERRAHLPNEVAADAREVLHRGLASLTLDDTQRGTVYCALREIGDDASVKLIKKLPPLTGSWAGVDRQVIARIRKRSPS